VAGLWANPPKNVKVTSMKQYRQALNILQN
jgi:hypothetical protein